MNKLVSIIAPTYNCLPYLKDCLAQIEKLPKDLVELIVINDGATDGTKEFLTEYATLHPEVIIVHQVNGGLSDARNTGLSRATGEYIFFCDTDDEIIPDSFIKMMDVLLEKKPDLLVMNFINQLSDMKSTKIYYPRKKLGKTSGPQFILDALSIRKWGPEVYQFLF